MQRTATILVSVLAVAPACSTRPAKGDATHLRASSRDAWALPSLEHAVSARDGRTGERLSFNALLDALAQNDAVFVGETHIDETTHAVELAIFEGVHDRRGGRTVLAMEMFERDVQPVLDRYLAGAIDEAAFLKDARPWGNYRTAYRPLVESARRHGAPVVASNFPAPLRRKMGGGGLEALDAADRAWVPKELFANTPEYWRRVDNAIRGHVGMMGPAPAADDPRLTSTQSLWDNSMGEACALALARHPDHAVVHVNGGFHTEYWDGTARQFRLRAPNARVATVAVVPSSHPAVEETGGLPFADFVVFAEERAQDVDEGTYAVFVAREHEYRLHVPSTAHDAARVPLLVWLVDDGESAEDALRLWKARVGESCAIAVVEPPYREVQDDLAEGGRWFFADSFLSDLGAAREGVERAWGYVLRRLPVDPARTCVAGEGTGATLAASIGVWGGGLRGEVLAFEPRRFSRLKDVPLPLPELRGDAPPPARRLRVVARDADQAWWRAEVDAYLGVSLDATLASPAADAWASEIERENAVRAALGIAARSPKDAPRAHVVADGPRARSWARLDLSQRAGEPIALVAAAPGDDAASSAIELRVRAAEFADAARFPRAPGPFGGTTVFVVPDEASTEDRAAWHALESSVQPTSRFHRLVVADATGARALPVVLGELAAKNRMNVLIAPAVWCADDGTMRALRRDARAFEDRMTLHWRPGLGGL